MFENDDVSQPPEKHPVVSLMLILTVVFVGFVIVGPIIGFVLSLPFFPGGIVEYADAIQHITDHPEIKLPLYILQGCATFIGLIIGPALFLKTERKGLYIFFQDGSFQLIPIALTIVIVVVFMAVNSVFIQWNAEMHLPGFLKWFEEWAREKEDSATELTKFITQFDSPIQVGIALFVIAVLPAFGEEIVFRGLIQNEFYRATKNIHVSIWISAVLFSAIHFQFFGFVPRMLLGALFGYLYYWSGNLSMAILAHFINNGLSVIAMYFYQRGYFDMDLESTDAAPWPTVLFSAVLTIVLLYFFWKFYQKRPDNSLNL
jgi:membrane protease YdiL (CAAX protease family)